MMTPPMHPCKEPWYVADRHRAAKRHRAARARFRHRAATTRRGWAAMRNPLEPREGVTNADQVSITFGVRA